MRKLIGRNSAEKLATFIPVPGSKAADDPDYDDRLMQVLQRSFQGWKVDLPQMLRVTKSTDADHNSNARLSGEELLAITHLHNPSATPVHPIVIVVDDVLESGKHFKVAKSVITAAFPKADVRCLFLARCVRDNILEEFDVIDSD